MSSGKSYDQPLVISYGYGVYDFANAGLISAIPVPFGKTRCRVEEIAVQATEVFTTGGKIELGTAADPNRYAELVIGTLADTEGLNITDEAAELFDIGHGGKGIIDVGQEAIVQIEVVFTTSTTTGIAATVIVLGWW